MIRTHSPYPNRTALSLKPIVAITSAMLGWSASVDAQPAPSSGAVLEEVIVTSQKREENLQSVPISIQALDAKKLVDLQVANFDDYARYLPSLSVQSYGPGQAQLYVRGVTNGGDGLHTGSEPLVGLYFDEMPVTTIANNLDIHIYDVARVEALSGPQGTLFGASSMAGTLRIITNKPDPAKFEAGYDITGEDFTAGAAGGKIEGFVNVPVTDQLAVRLVGWAEHDGGYINVVQNGSEYYPTSGAVRDDSQFVQKHSNPVDTAGGRLTMRLNLNDSWSITPTLITQSQTAYGQEAYTPFAVTIQPVQGGAPMTLGGSGDLDIARFAREINTDDWTMGTLVVEGKVSAFDLTYAAGYLKRTNYNVSDYSDYSLFYDTAYTGWGNVFTDKNGTPVNPAQLVIGRNLFTKQSQELRLATPKEWRLHGVAGLFLQRQYNDSNYAYEVANLGPAFSIDGESGTDYLDHSFRTDRDSALFTDLTYDLTRQFALTGGIRFFHYDNTVTGFSGFNYASGRPGEQQCFTPIDPGNPSLPCQNVNARATKTSNTHRINATYQFDDSRMMYVTWSTGFRPGGVNRLTTVPPYNPDYLTNYELGAKTTWLDRRLRINGAVFYEKWTDAQFGVAGPYAITEILNSGQAGIRGLEAEVQWVPRDGLTLSTSLTLLDAKLLANACQYASPSGSCTEAYNDPVNGLEANAVLAPSGTRLPVSAKIKGNTIARYEWGDGDYRQHAQLALVYQSNVLPALKTADEAATGAQPGYGSADLAFGVSHHDWHTELYIQNVTDRRGEVYRYTTCVPEICSLINVIPIKPRLVGLSFGQQF